MERGSPCRANDDEDHLPQHELARRLYAQRQRTTKPVGKKRKQQNAQIEEICQELVDLNQQLETLTQSRDLVVAQQLHRFDDLDGSSVKAVSEYFRVFRHGLILAPIDGIAFLDCVMLEAIRINGFTGRCVAIEQWKTHSLCWGTMAFTLVDTIVFRLTDREAMVASTFTFTLTISRLTLAMIFPHILQSKGLVQRLIGRKLVGHGRQNFVYDGRAKQFVRVVVALDFVRAFSTLLPDPSGLAMLFEKALITDAFFVGAVDAVTLKRSAEKKACNHCDGKKHQKSLIDMEERREATPPPRNVSNKMQLNHIL